MGQYLDEKLEQYGKSDYYPFHMPGHKRAEIDFPNPYKIDITEIEGFDNLHHSEDILLKAQNRAGKLYDSRKTYYLVNGSTCGILAAISAAVHRGDKILMARNSHKSVYHAVYLKSLSAVYLNPGVTSQGILGSIRPEDVGRKLAEYPDIKAVVITSPTYDGIVSDVEKIVKIVHKYHIPLIVDEAHGAHFGFSEYFPQTAVRLGADVVIQSMHKQLPCFTQTALLHLNSDIVDEKQIEKYLGIYETSSPSYILMAGMEKCIRFLKEKKEELFLRYQNNLDFFYDRVKELQNIQVVDFRSYFEEDVFLSDPSKLIISVKDTDYTGRKLYDLLLKKYHLQMEMESGFYVLGMTSIMDKKEGLIMLIRALKDIDQCLLKSGKKNVAEVIKRVYGQKEKKIEFYEAMELDSEEVSFEEASGRISGASVFLYPPGIPILLPGEMIDRNFIEYVRECIKLNMNLFGIADIKNERINVIASVYPD